MLLRESSLVWCHPGKEDVEQSSEVKWEIFKFPLNSFPFETFFSCTAWYLDSEVYSCWVFKGHCNMNSAPGIIGFLGMLNLVFLLIQYLKKHFFPSVIRNYPLGNNKWEISDCRVYIHIEFVTQFNWTSIFKQNI